MRRSKAARLIKQAENDGWRAGAITPLMGIPDSPFYGYDEFGQALGRIYWAAFSEGREARKVDLKHECEQERTKPPPPPPPRPNRSRR